MAHQVRQPDGQPVGPLFDLAPRRVYLARPTLAVRRWALTPPFHHHPFRGCTFSAALSITGDCPRSSALNKRILRPVESGLSSALRQRPVTRASLQKKNFKDRAFSRGKERARTSCTRRSTGAFRPHRSSRWRQRADRRTAAARDGNRHKLRRA